MEERVNLCREIECPAACCRDMYMYGLSLAELDESFGMENVTFVRDRSKLLDGRERGVYYSFDADGGVIVFINGRCINLGEDLSCRRYSTRPGACRNFVFGWEVCNKIRKRDGLPKVPLARGQLITETAFE